MDLRFLRVLISSLFKFKSLLGNGTFPRPDQARKTEASLNSFAVPILHLLKMFG